MNTQQEMNLQKNWKRILVTKIILANLLFPLMFLVLNQYYVRYFSLTFECTFKGKFLAPFRFDVFQLYIILVTIAVASMFIILRPFFIYVERKQRYREARVAALRIPWFLTMIHAILWSLGPTYYYAAGGWEPVHGMPYIWALLTDVSTGLVAVVCVILAINNSLVKVKTLLNITDTRENEHDNFIKYRNYIVVGSILAYAFIHNGYIAYFYYLYGLKFGREDITFLPFIIFNLYLFALAGAILYFSRRDYHFQIDLLKNKLDELTRGSINLSERIIIVNFDEVGTICNKINKFLSSFTGILQKVGDANTLLADSANSLFASSTEIATISNQQAVAVKEVVSTVEESDKAVNAMDEKINEVASLIKEDEEAIGKGFTMIQESLRKMDEIKASNNRTIQGIRSLGEQLESIWEIVRIINSIADQTKIIAFNAELEASAAGEAGKNFQIVASEIRRLADKTVASTKEIKSKIDEIQHSSDFLVTSSEKGTAFIREGWELSHDIGIIFSNIHESTELSTSSAQQIIHSCHQVVSASSQILMTLRQINAGIENFVESTKFTSNSAENLKKMADSLQQVVINYRRGDTEKQKSTS